MRSELLIIASVCVLLASELYAGPPAYYITDLGTLGGTSSSGRAISPTGVVVGESTAADGFTRAFLYDGTMHDLGTLGGAQSGASGINRFGHVTGSSWTAPDPVTQQFNVRAFRYDGTMHDLGALDGDYSYGADINASGTVAGNAFVAGRPMAFSYSGGAMRPLGTLGGSSSHAYAINDAGQIVGDAYLPGNVQRAALYQDGMWHDLGTLGGLSVARGISENGLITGHSGTSSGAGQSHAFLYENGSMRDLGTLDGHQASTGQGVNSAGVVVGYSLVTQGTSNARAFLYTRDTGMLDLNSLIDPGTGWELTVAYAINDAGQITGSGRIGNEFHAFLLTPVPEPSACLGLGCTAALAGRLSRRRRSERTGMVRGGRGRRWAARVS